MRLHHRPGGGFRNPWPAAAPAGFRALFKWMVWERLKQGRPDDPGPPRFPRVEPGFATPRAAPAAVTVTWVGQATFLLQIGGLNVLTDPMWSERASPVQFAGPRRHTPPGLAFETLPPVDLVLLSHNHYDHLDRNTVRRLAVRFPDARWLAPLGVGAALTAWGARHVRDLDWWDAERVADLTVTGTPAQHFSGRGFRDRDRTLWCGWALRAGGRAVWFAGDTGYHSEFGTIGARCGPFELALLPVGAYEPRWFMRPVHMNPEDAVQAYLDVRAGQAGEGGYPALIPMHWGTFKLTDEPMAEPPRRTSAAWRAAGLPPEALWVLAPGETRVLGAAPPD
jgi:N-acyl-phosphatidylethanolamine-hydrolysing phospholipase D